ncbi:unnamed protein product [Linum trigynum]|uniref:Uncharacterized protein n=1 Tax=Linum trigynum TaxID=586398 RepID=A0AAV2E690_9ROSI
MEDSIVAMTPWTRSKCPVSEDPASVFPEPTKKKKYAAMAGQVFDMEKLLDHKEERFQTQIQHQLCPFKREIDQNFEALKLRMKSEQEK